MQDARASAGLGRMIGLGGLFTYIYCMMASQAIVASPLFGAALFMCSQVTQVFFSTYTGTARMLFSRAERIGRTVLLGVLLLSVLSLVLIYPGRLSNENAWMIFGLVLATAVRDGLCRRVIRAEVQGLFTRRRFWLYMALLHLIPAVTIAAVFLTNLPLTTAWLLVAGYGLCDLLALWFQLLDRGDQAYRRQHPPRSEAAAALHTTLRSANAFRVYDALSALIIIAVDMSAVLCFSFMGLLKRDTMLIALLISLGVAFLFYMTAELLLRHYQRRRTKPVEPTNLLLAGLFLWLYGLNSFRHAIDPAAHTPDANLYFCLGLCTAGSALSLTAVTWLERAMRSVAHFTVGQAPVGYDTLRTASRDMATLIGQMLTLGLLTLMVFTHPGSGEGREVVVHPLLLFPALALVVACIVFTFRFPLSANALHKLRRFLRLEEKGDRNEALRSQLEQVVLQPSRQPFATRVVRWLLRHLIRHRLQGVENIHPDDSNPIVFICNHGEIHGPLAAVANIPVYIRPWVISEMVLDKKEVAEYVYKYTFSGLKWMPGWLKWPVSRLTGRLSVACFRQLQGIPVYRNQPKYLMKTFRASTEALETGDNLLIFPENPEANTEDPGYKAERLLDFFEGFALLGQVYHMRTGKNCRFLPMYIHKGLRTITFGTEFCYDPDNKDIQQEIKRISDECYRQMHAIMEAEDAKYREKHHKPEKAGD